MSKYGHRDTNFKVEDKLTPIGIGMLYDVFPGICVHQIPSYKHGEGTQRQRSLQAKGVDVISVLSGLCIVFGTFHPLTLL